MGMSQMIILAALAFAGAQGTIEISINDVVRLALEGNKDILVERLNVEVSEGDVLKERGVFDPLLELSSSFTDSESPTASTFIESGIIDSKTLELSAGISGTLPTGTFYDLLRFEVARTKTTSQVEVLSPSWVTNLSFSIGQELLRGFGTGSNLARIRVAKRTGDVSRKELERVISDTLVEVQRAYWNLVAAYKFLELANTALELALDLQKRNEIQVEVGVLPPVTVTQARSEVAARKVDVITAENDLEAGEDILKNLLSISLGLRLVPTDEPTIGFTEINEEEVIALAMKKRPEIAQSKLEIENRVILKKFYSNQRLPRLMVQGSLLFQGLGGEQNPGRIVFGDTIPEPISEQFNSGTDAFRQLGEGDFPTWQVMGVLSFPLTNAGARGEYRKAAAELERSVIRHGKAVEDVELDVRNSIREVHNSLKKIEAANISVQLVEEVLGNEEERLKVGVGTTREVLEAQRDLVDARFGEIRAVADYNIAIAALERAKGTIIDSYGVEISE